ncbi:MAG: hypothetical protein BMS9Abin36_0791 [Gammaproteobacteria bacterium]|nr:MAG: hypothetical protein BMS9Abin36_0791 [Gammaproteobacteria bacterium]
MKSPTDLVYSITEVMAALKVSRNTVYEEIKAERLKTFRVGRRRFVSAEALNGWIKSREAEAA